MCRIPWGCAWRRWHLFPRCLPCGWHLQREADATCPCWRAPRPCARTACRAWEQDPSLWLSAAGYNWTPLPILLVGTAAPWGMLWTEIKRGTWAQSWPEQFILSNKRQRSLRAPQSSTIYTLCKSDGGPAPWTILWVVNQHYNRWVQKVSRFTASREVVNFGATDELGFPTPCALTIRLLLSLPPGWIYLAVS